MTLQELFGSAFNLDDLSEEAQGKILAVFQAKVKDAVDAGIVEARTEIQSEFDAKLEEEKDKLAESVNSYMTRTSDKWLEENKIAVTEQSRIDLSENLLADMKDLLEKHNVKMPEGKEDILEKKDNEIASITEKYNASVKEIEAKDKEFKDLGESHVEFKRGLVLTSVTEGMADTQIEKVKSLTEEIEYVDAKDFKGKIEAVIDSIDESLEESEEDKAARLAKEAEDLNEEIKPEVKKVDSVNSRLF